jgi:putative transposase
VRYGYRRVHVHLRRDGWKINMKKTRRIYSELGLQLRNKHPKRRVKAKLRDDRQEAVGPNDVWAMPCPDRRLLANAEKGISFTTISRLARSCAS